jgi:amidohydrolase
MPHDWLEQLDQAIDARFEQMVAIRRHLHQYPEVSGQERETSFYLYQLLGDQGIDVRMGPEGRGLIADLAAPAASAPPAARGLMALRADIDALPIHDEKTAAYRSCRDGVMHACGHDAHTAILIGALTALDELQQRGRIPWPLWIRGIFEPSEETARGSREMIDVEAMADVSAILTLHVDPTRKLGTLGLRAGVLTANCDEIEFRIVGRGGHGARPHEASDPIAAAAQLINALYLYVPRITDSREAVVVTIGQVKAGHTANVIPEEVILRGTVRTLERDVRATTLRYVERLAEGIGRTTDTRIEVGSHFTTPSVVNDPQMIELLRRVIRSMGSGISIDEISRPSMGSEDFAVYLEHAPGAMFRLGCTSERAGGVPLHNSEFDIDERALRIGARVLARAAVCWSDPSQGTFPPSAPVEARA